jgi:hypothetical protein
MIDCCGQVAGADPVLREAVFFIGGFGFTLRSEPADDDHISGCVRFGGSGTNLPTLRMSSRNRFHLSPYRPANASRRPASIAVGGMGAGERTHIAVALRSRDGLRTI